METRQVLEQEGRDAKNLIGYHILGNSIPSASLTVDQRATHKRPVLMQRPPIIGGGKQKDPTNGNGKSAPRVRSASTGRDKRSELQSRYWALLFGNLQNAINEIYQTVECYENISSCQEAILVLENYIRDFKALAEWFKVSWDYEATPPPQRPQSLAWEIRKSNPAPKVRAKSLTSPVLSGKSSPSYSGKNSPCQTTLQNANLNSSDVPLIQIKEIPEDYDLSSSKKTTSSSQTEDNTVSEEGTADIVSLSKMDAFCQTDLDDDNLTLVEYLEKYKDGVKTDDGSIKTATPQEIPKSPQIQNPEVATLNTHTQQSEPFIKTTVSPKVEVKKSISPKYSQVLNRSTTASNLTTPVKNKPALAVRVPMVSNRTSAAAAPAVTKRQSITNRPSVAPIAQTRISTVVRSAVTPSQIKPNQTLKAKSSLLLHQKSDIPLSGNMTNNRLTIRSKTMIGMSTKPNKSSSSLESSSSTLIASNEQLSVSHKTDLKNSPSNDGWLTVKTRRRSLHWANRFHQPTGYASLPTLSLLNENEPETQSTVEKTKSSKPKVDAPPPSSLDEQKKEKYTKKNGIRKPPEKSSRDRKVNSAPTCEKPLVPITSNIQRQKSDLTGLKLKSLRKEYLRSEKTLSKEKVKPPEEESSLNSLEMAEDANSDADAIDITTADADFNEKVDMKIQTTSMFSESVKELYSMCNQYDDDDDHHLHLNPLTLSTINQSLSSCDELEERDAENDENQRKLLEEQESLERQIRELENAEIDVDTETDETDCEVTIDLDSEINEEIGSESLLSETDENMSLEMRYHAFLSEMSIVERSATLATLQALVARHPGRAQELHQKLSSPSRRRSLHETLRKYQAKQARAQEKRELLYKEKSLKIQHLLTRVEDVKAAKQQLIEEKRMRMEERLQRAAENRTQFLKDKVRKAHDEEEKLREIAFIKNLEAQNKRLDVLESFKEYEVRMQDIEQERQKKVEEKAAKEAAAGRRRFELERERQEKLEKLRETRREREKRIGKMQEQKEKIRQAKAMEKARGREERRKEREAKKEADIAELQRKIIQKQQESARRHEENIEHIRQRALELSIPTRNLDENGQHIGFDRAGEEFPSDLSSTVSDVSREVSKAAKKKLKKLKQKLQQKSEEYLEELQEVPAHMRKDSQVPKLLNTIVKGGGPMGVERPLGQLLRLIAKAQVNDFQCLWLMKGLETVTDIVKNGMEAESTEISKRAVLLAVQLYRNSCSLCPQIARHAILGNTITMMLDCLLMSLQLPEETTPLHPVELSTELILACTVVLSPTNSLKTHPKVMERLPDILSYSVMIGLVDILTLRCRKIREPIENHQSVVLSVLATIGLLTKFAEICPKGPDTTKFLATVKNTELFGAVTLLYSTIVPIGECLPPRTISLAAATLNLLVTLASVDLSSFQDVLSEECMSMKLLDVATVLLTYCGPKSMEKGETQAVIVDLIATLGFFCANRKENQNLLTSEQSLMIIKSLTKLPKHFNMVIYPALVTITHNNDEALKLLEKDFDVQLLLEYKNSDAAKKNHLVSVLQL